jgi:prepilin-type N-terminal cleavage/methylation domain-containing protein
MLTHRRGRTSLRGFTLVELMVVVLIIAISAALAIPSIMNVVRGRKVQRSAAEIFSLVSDARGRSFGRGSGVRVVWDGTVSGGTLTMTEAVRDIDGLPGFADVPEPLCWGIGAPAAFAVSERQIAYWVRPNNDGNVISTLTLNANVYPGVDPTTTNTVDLCFTPRGMLYQNVAGNWVRANGVFSWRFQSAINNVAANPFIAGRGDFSRFVHVAPNGVARLSL